MSLVTGGKGISTNAIGVSKFEARNPKLETNSKIKIQSSKESETGNIEFGTL
jgi:hypothetical protein